MPAARSFDVVTLGGGIVGCACARECALSGMSVALVEAHTVAGGTTAAGMGHVVVLDDSPAQLALTQYARGVWQELSPQLPATVEYEARGTVWIAADAEEMTEVHAKQARLKNAGVDSAVLDAQSLASEEPNLRAGLAGGLLVPGDAVIDPPAAAKFFLDEAVRAGAVLTEGQHAVKAGAGSVTLSNGDVYASAQIVIATGVDSSLVPWLKIERRKGHLVLTDRSPGFARHQLVELGYAKSARLVGQDSVAFNLQPRQSAQLVIGSSRQYADEDAAINGEMLTRMLDRAYAYMPGLQKLRQARVWTGFRAATADKLPLIGATDDRSVFVAMGFEGLGITSAPGAARLLLDQLLGRQSVIDTSPYQAARLFSTLSTMETP